MPADKQEFGRRLLALMRAKGWRQADLARAAFGTMTDANGRTVARRRDSISSYLRGKVFPDPRSLDQLAVALNLPVEELTQNLVESATHKEEPEFEIRQVVGHPDRALLRVNRTVTMDQAIKIATILNTSA